VNASFTVPAGSLVRSPSARAVLSPQPRIRLDTGEAESRRRLLAAFDGLAFADGDRTLVGEASIESPEDRQLQPWLWFDTGLGPIAAAALQLDGRPFGWPADSVGASTPALLQAMARLEFAIESLETFAPDWRPARFGPGEGRRLRLDLKAEDGRLVHRLALCVPDTTCAALPARGPQWLEWGRTPVPSPALLTVSGPQVGRQALKTLAVGDLVWLGENPRCEGRLILAGAVQAEGLFDPDLRQFHTTTSFQAASTNHGRTGDQSMPLDHSGGEDGPAAPLLQDLPVRINFEFGPWPAQLAEVSRIAPGSVIPAPFADGDLEVRITVEDRTIARGRLVAVGQRYGVLVDTVER